MTFSISVDLSDNLWSKTSKNIIFTKNIIFFCFGKQVALFTSWTISYTNFYSTIQTLYADILTLCKTNTDDSTGFDLTDLIHDSRDKILNIRDKIPFTSWISSKQGKRLKRTSNRVASLKLNSSKKFILCDFASDYLWTLLTLNYLSFVLLSCNVTFRVI